MKKALVLAMLASPAMAQEAQQPKCYSKAMVDVGEASVGRQVVFSGLTGQEDTLITIYAGENGASWVLFTVTPNGVACLITGGLVHTRSEPLVGEES